MKKDSLKIRGLKAEIQNLRNHLETATRYNRVADQRTTEAYNKLAEADREVSRLKQRALAWRQFCHTLIEDLVFAKTSQLYLPKEISHGTESPFRAVGMGAGSGPENLEEARRRG